jgi:hypothetical protein
MPPRHLELILLCSRTMPVFTQQRSMNVVFSAVKLWCERWNTEINEEKTRAIYFSRSLRVPEDVLQLNGQDIPSVNKVWCLDVHLQLMSTSRKRGSIYCDVRPESCNLRICWAGLLGARSRGNTKYTVTLAYGGTFVDMSMVATF